VARLAVGGAPVRGLSALDRRRERYFFVVARDARRDLVTYFAATGEHTVRPRHCPASQRRARETPLLRARPAGAPHQRVC
jgi:hypothetical protein